MPHQANPHAGSHMGPQAGQAPGGRPDLPGDHVVEQEFARDTIREQARAVLGLVEHVGPSFHRAVDLICAAANADNSHNGIAG